MKTNSTKEPTTIVSKRFDYKIDDDAARSSELAFLQERGSQGWELVTSIPGDYDSCKYIFKREIA